MRLHYEATNDVKFQWVVNARPDNVYVNPMPDLRQLDPDSVYVPSWGHGFTTKSSPWGVPPQPLKRRPGLNNRFAFG